MNENEIKMERYAEVVFDLTANCYDKLMKKYEDSRWVLETIKSWAHEFEDWWDAQPEDSVDYIEAVDAFAERHLRAELGWKKYVVRCNRVERYEATFLVEAEDTAEARKIVEDAVEGDDGYYVEKMTECINVDKQYFEVMSVWDGKTECDFDLTKE